MSEEMYVIVETPIEEDRVDDLLRQDEDEYGVHAEVLGYGPEDGILVQYTGSSAELWTLVSDKYPDWVTDNDYAERISDYRE